MDEDKRLKLSRYIYGGGFIVQLLCITPLISDDGIWALFYLGSFVLMALGLYLNLKVKGLKSFREYRFSVTALIIFFPVLGPLVAIGVMYGTPASSVPMPRWQSILFSPKTIGLCVCVVLVLIIIPSFYSSQAYRAKATLLLVKEHLAVAGKGGKQEVIHKELNEAASWLTKTRSLALTDANTGWYLRWSLSNMIIKESELAALEKEIDSAKTGGPGKRK